MPRLLTPSRVADFRNRLCDVAMELLAEVGYDGFNMRELASRLGVSAMTAYRYFKDKDEILATVRTRAFDRLADVLEAASAGPGTPATRCAAVARAYIQFARQEPIYYRLMFESPRRALDPTPDFQRAESRVRAAFSQYLRVPSGDGSFRGNPELIGQVVWSALHGIVTLRMSEKLTGSESDGALSESLRLVGLGYDELASAHLHLPQSGQWSEPLGAHHQSPYRHGKMASLPAAG